MIDQETQLKIQAFLDGELAEAEAREIAALIAKDRDAAALHAELKNTRQAISLEQGMKLPESREFYWSKIKRDIERLEQTKPVEASPSIWQFLSPLLKPVAAVAVVVVLGAIVLQQSNGPGSGGSDVQVASADMDAITFRDDSNGTTYVWFSDAPQNDVANTDDDTTLD